MKRPKKSELSEIEPENVIFRMIRSRHASNTIVLTGASEQSGKEVSIYVTREEALEIATGLLLAVRTLEIGAPSRYQENPEEALNRMRRAERKMNQGICPEHDRDFEEECKGECCGKDEDWCGFPYLPWREL